MLVKRHSYDTDGSDYVGAIEPEISTDSRPTCPANIGSSDFEYEPCGLPMRKHKNGDTFCKVHGEMH